MPHLCNFKNLEQYHCEIFYVPFRLIDTTNDTSRKHSAFCSFAEKPDGFIRKLCDDGHPLPIGIEFKNVQSSILPSPTKDFDSAHVVNVSTVHDAEP